MHPLHHAALTAAGAQYKIIAEDGTEYGELQVVPPKAHRTWTRQQPYGEMTAYFLPTVENMQPGDVVIVEPGKYEPARLRGAVGAWAAKKWGAGNSITSVNKQKGVVEVMRVC